MPWEAFTSEIPSGSVFRGLRWVPEPPPLDESLVRIIREGRTQEITEELLETLTQEHVRELFILALENDLEDQVIKEIWFCSLLSPYQQALLEEAASLEKFQFINRQIMWGQNVEARYRLLLEEREREDPIYNRLSEEAQFLVLQTAVGKGEGGLVYAYYGLLNEEKKFLLLKQDLGRSSKPTLATASLIQQLQSKEHQRILIGLAVKNGHASIASSFFGCCVLV